MKMIVDSNEVLSPEEACKILDIGIATFWRWKRKGKVITLNFQGRVAVPKSEVTRLKK